MGNFSELSGLKQWAALVLGAALITAALYFTLFKSQRAANDQAQAALELKLRENAELESYAPKLEDMERQLANLKQQLEIERKIVPDEKEVDGFIKMLDAEAMKAGIEIRRYTAKPVSTREFYTEVPFEVELDGPYLLGAELFRPGGKAGTDREHVRLAGREHQEAERRQGETHLSIRAQRKHRGYLRRDDVL